MKQRLLLALLVLFASVGMVKAQGNTLTIPANSPTVKLTVTPGNEKVSIKIGEIELTGTNNAYTVTPLASDQIVTITGTTISKLTIDGYVSSADLSLSSLTELIFSNNRGKLSSLTLSGTNLTTLTVDDCALTSLPTKGLSSTAALVTVNARRNKITSVSGVVARGEGKKLTYNLDGNQITTIPNVVSNVTFNYGTQVIEASLSSNPIANKWFNVQTQLIKGSGNTAKIPALENLLYSDLKSISWQDKDNHPVTLTQGDNKWDYKFFAGNKFLSGAMQCVITPKSELNLPSYRVTFNVDPAQFKFKQTPATSGDDNGNTLSVQNTTDTDNSRTAATVWEGDELYLSPTAASGYEFDKYTFSGLVSTTIDNIYKVAVTKVDQEEVSVVAAFTQKTYNVTINASANGSVSIKDQDNKEVTVGSNTLPAGTVLYITATPNEGYEALVSQSGSVVTKNSEGVYECKIKAASTISINFQVSSTNPKLTVNKGNEISTVTINGSSYEKEIEIKPGNTVMVEVEPSAGYNVTQIILDGTVIASNSKKAQFTMPPTNAVLTFKVVSASTIAIVPGENEYTYDAKEKEFAFTTIPDGLTGFTVKYAREGIDNYLTDKPKASGIYHVSLYRAADNLYSKVDVKYAESETDVTGINKKDLIVKIYQATPNITSANVSVNANNQYVVSGSASVPGKFAVVDEDDNEVTTCIKNENHNVSVKFTPTDNTNYESVKMSVPVKVDNTNITTHKVSWKIPEGMKLTVKNGDKEITTSGTEIAEGIELTLSLSFPAGYTSVKLVEDNSDATVVLQKDENDELESPLTGTYEVKKAVTFVVKTEGEANTVQTPKVEIKAPTNSITYDGAVKLVSTSNNGKDYYVNWVNPQSIPSTPPVLKITYKDSEGKAVVSPVNAGKYTVCVHIPEFTSDGTTYKATDQEFTDAFEIKKARATVSEWPGKAVLGTGLTLSQATFIGGSANVAGKFAFINGTEKPVENKEYSVKFVPTDTDNYEEVTVDETNKPCQLAVTVSNQRIVAFDNIVNGTITVKGNDGVTYKSGDALPASVTSVTITATANTGYKLATLSVNGTSFTNGSSYTLGETSITIAATFDAYYTVTVTKPSKGAVVTLPSSSEVKAGGSYEITVTALAADMSKIVVKDGSTTITGSNGKYTISNITANKSITITLDNPTAITFTSEETLSTGGKSMGTITYTGLTDNKCYYGDKVTVKATPVSGVTFVGWSGRTETTPTLSITATDASYTFKALYSGSPTGIETIEGVKVYGSKGNIVINCDSDAFVTIISMNGQSKKVAISGDTRIPAGAGIYGVVLEKGGEVLRTKVVVR